MESKTYIPQTPQVRNVVQSFWQLDVVPGFHTEHIIPKGIVEIIFNFSLDARVEATVGGKKYRLPACFINGYNTSPIQVELPKRIRYFGVVLQPLAVKKFFRVPACEFSDSPVDLTLVDPAISSLWGELAEVTEFNQRVSIFTAWITKKMFDWLPQERFMNDFLLCSERCNWSVSELADQLCYSPRHMSRKISEVTGMNTEEILLYKKYLHAVDLLHQTDMSLTEVANASYFSDQSHFIRTFKAYTFLTPGAYRKNSGRVKGHIFQDVR